MTRMRCWSVNYRAYDAADGDLDQILGRSLWHRCLRTKRTRSDETKTFTGLLAEPIAVKRYHPTLVGLTAQEAANKTAEEAARVTELLLTKFNLLFEHYGIARSTNSAEGYCALCLPLALELVPGFQLVDADKVQRGRPKRNPLDLIRLLADTEVVKRRKKQVGAPASDAKALAELTTNSTFASRWGRHKEATLANLLSEARNPVANPLYRLWTALKGQPAGEIREDLIDMFSITRMAL